MMCYRSPQLRSVPPLRSFPPLYAYSASPRRADTRRWLLLILRSYLRWCATAIPPKKKNLKSPMETSFFLRIWKITVYFFLWLISKQGGKSSNTLGFSITNVQHFIKWCTSSPIIFCSAFRLFLPKPFSLPSQYGKHHRNCSPRRTRQIRRRL